MKVIAAILFLTLTAFGRQISTVDEDYQADVTSEDCPSENKVIRAPDEVDDPVVVDGDILVSKEQAAIYKESGWDGLVKSEAWGNTYRWRSRIPYQISNEISSSSDSKITSVYKNIKSSMKEIQDRTCITFEKATCTDFAYLYIAKGDECYTYLGAPLIGYRSIYLAYNCAGKNSRAMTPAHEIMHTMGRYHEQTRPDRDEYVEISKDNTCPPQMEKQKDADTVKLVYDYDSVMHYSRWQCAASYPGSPSMTYTKYIHNPDYVGQRSKLSSTDIQHIKAIHCSSMMMRLVGGQDNSEGRLEVNNEEVWGTVCSDGFDRNDANVVCKYLGRPGVEEVYSAADILNIESAQDSPIWLSDLECNGQEDNPFHCSQKVMKHHTNCDHNQDVAIKCSKAAHLVGGNDNSGRLEVYHEGQWGSVCSHKFHYREANVACRMMGYSSAVQVFTNVESEYDDTVDNKIVLSQLTCDGTENHLSDCHIRHAHICQGRKPVYLECTNGQYYEDAFL